MGTHTPGPWEWDGVVLVRRYQQGESDSNLVGEWDEAILANLDDTELAADFVDGGGRGFVDWSVSEANARLIAAAPDLLDALIDARKQLEAYEEALNGEDYNSPRINEAIAKATGGEQ